MAETFGNALRRLRVDAALSLRELARRAAVDPGHLSRIQADQRPPTAQIAAALDHTLAAGGVLAALARQVPVSAPPPVVDVDDERDAFELADRIAASDVSSATLRAIEFVADQIAIAYHSTPPTQLLPDVRRYLRYVAELLDKRMTLSQRAQLLTAAGWLSLLGATLHIDLHQRPAAAARLATARSLAGHVGHPEIDAWCLETRAWDALTEGHHRAAVELSQAAQRIAPPDGSARIRPPRRRVAPGRNSATVRPPATR